MSLRRALASVAAGVGLTAVANRVLAATAPDLEPPLSGRQRSYRWRGMDVAYTEAGDPGDRTLVLLHGINAAGSAGEFREVFDDLAAEYHVVAPDLPGFGRSDRPPLRYSAALYEEFVADFLTEFTTDEPPAVVASSLTGAYVAAADEAAVPVDSLTLICPTTVAGPEPPRPFLRELLRLPVLGEALFNALGSKPSIRYFNADHGYDDPALPVAEWVEYEWATTHQENARFAPASFVAGFLNSGVDLGDALAARETPVTILWGREADITPVAQGRELAEAADARLVVVDRAKLLPHVEHPDSLLRELGVEDDEETTTGGGSGVDADATVERDGAAPAASDD
ncbi:MAG: alpha/beta fold hydrolase [Halolamina sp.]